MLWVGFRSCRTHLRRGHAVVECDLQGTGRLHRVSSSSRRGPFFECRSQYSAYLTNSSGQTVLARDSDGVHIAPPGGCDIIAIAAAKEIGRSGALHLGFDLESAIPTGPGVHAGGAAPTSRTGHLHARKSPRRRPDIPDRAPRAVARALSRYLGSGASPPSTTQTGRSGRPAPLWPPAWAPDDLRIGQLRAPSSGGQAGAGQRSCPPCRSPRAGSS